MSITVNNLELEDTNLNEMSRFLAGTSHKKEFQNSVVQYNANRKNHDTQTGEDECEGDNWGREELYEEEYWKQSQPAKKGSGFKNKYPSECCNEVDDNFITYRKTRSKDQKERQLRKRYKLDKFTVVLIEKLVGVKNIGPYHDAIGEGRNSIVIEVGYTVVQYFQHSQNYKNAVKIHKLTNDDAKNKAIFQRTQRECDQMNIIIYPHISSDVPYRVRYCKNIIVTRRIGTDDVPAVPITMVPSDLCSKLYDLIVRYISYLYTLKTGLVHGNLCAKSILCWQETPFFVGWAYSVRLDHRNALKKLMKDCYFVTKFFKRGVNVKSTEELFKHVTKLEDISREVLDVIDKSKQSKNQKYSKSDAGQLCGNSRFK